MPTAIGTFPIGTEAIASTVVRDIPQVTITAPGSVVTANPVTLAWTYLSGVSRPQASYRYLVKSQAGSLLFDSGTVAGAVTTAVIGYTFPTAATFTVELRLSDGLDEGSAEVTFSTELPAIVVPDNTQVGSVYEVAIDGVGYMLADHPDTKFQHQRQTVQLDPQRLVTGDTPFNESIERYSIVSHADWDGGSDQLYLNRAESTGSRYSHSEGVNPFETGEISCLTQPIQHISSAYATPRAVVASGSVYVQTGNNELTGRSTPGGSNTVFTPMASGTVSALASDGANWYATNGSVIRRNTTVAAPAADWSTVAVTDIAWCADRLVGFDTAAVDPNVTTFSPSGAEEVATGRFTFPGATLKGMCGGDGYLWFGVNRADSGQVHAWQLDAAGQSFMSLSLPPGEAVDNLFFYLGNVMVASRTDDGQIKIYRCVPSEGRLTPILLVQFPASAAQTTFAGVDRFVGFAWPAMQRDGRSGVGVIDLQSGGFARWFVAPSGGGTSPAVSSVVRWNGEFAFTLAALGFWGKQATTVYGPGFLETSVADLGTTVAKVFDEVSLSTKPLLGSVALSYSTNANDTWLVAGTLASPGSTRLTVPVGVTTNSVGLRVQLTPSPVDTTPVVKMVSAKMHPQGLVDEVLVLPVDCADRRNGLNGVEIPGGPGFGQASARVLTGLVGRLVNVQDVSWPITFNTEVFQVVAVEQTAAGTWAPHVARRADRVVTVVTLRRPL